MKHPRRVQARDIVQRRVLSLIPRATPDGTTVTVARHYTVLGHPMSDSWSGDVPGFANRIALALYGVGDQDGPDDLHTSLRDQLGDALIAAGAVPATMPIEILAQAGVLADAVLPVAIRARDQTAYETAADRDRLALAVQFALQWKDSAPVGLREGIEEILATTPDPTEEEDIPAAGTIAAGTASTARGEILAVLLAAGYTESAAHDLVARTDTGVA